MTLRLLYILGFTASLMMVSCKSNKGATNEYKNAKVHPSETIAKEHKRESKKAHKVFLKQQKKNKKAINKKNGTFFKK